MAEEDPDQESTANSTLSRMLAGNRRFAEGHSEHPWQDMQTRESLIDSSAWVRKIGWLATLRPVFQQLCARMWKTGGDER